MPERIQRRRTRGWKMPPNTVSVTRPGKFGNPFSVKVYGLDVSLELFANAVKGEWTRKPVEHLPAAEADATYQLHNEWRGRLDYLPEHAIRTELRGKDLACWCALPAEGQPDKCHATQLLEIANA